MKTTSQQPADVPRVLIIDDDAAYTEYLSETLKKLGFEIDVALSLVAAIKLVKSKDYQIVITKFVLKGEIKTGADLLIENVELMREAQKIIIRDQFSEIHRQKELNELGVNFIEKGKESNLTEIIRNRKVEMPELSNKVSSKKDPYRLKGTLLAGKYRLEEYAGGGGMGAVYLASNEYTKQWVAVKILKPDIVARSPEYIGLFEHEVEAVKKINHPNIVKIFDSGTEDEISFMVMEWLDGQTLEDMIINERLEIEFVADVFRQVCDAFSLAHSLNIVHLDIKPANIFLLSKTDTDHFVKVIDFGLSKLLSSESGTTVTKFRGTHQYCSPEHFGGKLTNRSDIYSLAATLYNMLTGVIPFGTSYIYAKMYPNMELPLIPSILAQRPNFPQGLDRVIEKALSKNPENRQESVQILFDEFQQALIGTLPEANSKLLSTVSLDQINSLPEKRTTQPQGIVLLLRKLFSRFSDELAIDLGTSNTIVYAKGRGIVVAEPSIVAINKVTNQVEAIGRDAKELLGKPEYNIIGIKPIRGGAIYNVDLAVKMLYHFIRKAHYGKSWVRPRVLISILSESSQAERYIFEDSVYRAKASEVYFVEKAMAAAIGAGLPIIEPHGNMVVNIGGGITDIAVISLGGIVYSSTIRVAGNEMDESITQFIKRKYNLLIGERTAEAIKIALGSAFPLEEPLSMEVRGRNLIEGIPKTITITDEEIREALSDAVATIVNAVRVALERTPPELSADIVERGIVLTGGSALLKNLDKRLMIETGLPVVIADDPIASVVLGMGKMLSDFELLQRVKWG